MTRWVIAALVFGLLSATSVVGCLSSLNSVDRVGAQFRASPSVRYGFTTADRAGAMGFAAFISGLDCLGSIMAARRARSNLRRVSDPVVDPSAWKCPGCGEENPRTFGECWKCQSPPSRRLRESESRT
jgi:hypothetical protein